MEPLFSIITVTWNAAAVIAPTLHSVQRQSSSNYELLIIDGASSDDTLSIVKQASITSLRVFSEPDKGLYDAMNKGIARARGKYIMFLNAGDSFADDTVLARLALLTADNPGVIYGQTQLVDAQRNVVGKRHRDQAPDYDLQYRLSADYDWCIRVLRKSPANAYAGKAPIISYLADGMTTRHHRASLWERFRIMCHHYGTGTAVMRHLGFIPRYVKRRLGHSANKQ